MSGQASKNSIPKHLFKTPFNDTNIHLLIGKIGRAFIEKGVLSTTFTASLMTRGVSTHTGQLRKVFVATSATMASGESVVIDVLKNGVSMLSSTYTLDSTVTDKLIDLADLTVNTTQIGVGDLITCTGTYTAGGGPAHPSISVSVEWG